tara:strand:- start:955 stop:1458 length:504 start_codon:yes stop_codon:yes gene_type:complete
MNLKEALKFLEENEKFKEWKKLNPDDYFSYAFKTLMDNKDEDWQLGFYNKQDDSLTTFTIEGESVFIREDEEVFKKEESSVIPINMEDFKINTEEVIKQANEFKEKKYPNQKTLKIMAILQNLSDLGLVWNITFITENLNILNMKINAIDGKILSDKLDPIINFKQN